mgnify:CR=1 FL=1
MHKVHFIAILLFSACCAFAQQVETSRFEVERWSKNQDCHFVSFGDQGGMMVTATDKANEQKEQLWNFITLDTSLYDLKSDLIPLPESYALFDAKSSDRWAAFVFVNEKKQKTDSVVFWTVTYNRVEQEFNTFWGRLPERSTLQSIALIDGTLMLSVNGRTGNGFLSQYDLDSHTQRTITPSINNDYVLFQLTVVPESKEFVLAVREFEEKRYKATCFFVYSHNGTLLQSHRFENGENAGLGRMCFALSLDRKSVV